VIDEDYYIHKSLLDGSVNRRFYKVIYTAALRLGIELDINSEKVHLRFQGNPAPDLTAHGDNVSFKGTLYIKGVSFDDVFVILRPKSNGVKHSLITFWPDTQHPDAHLSYTDPLVDTAMAEDTEPYPVSKVSTKMHTKFKENAGVSPAALMHLLYQEELGELSVNLSDAENMISEVSEALDAAYEESRRLVADLEKVQIKNFEYSTAIDEKDHALQEKDEQIALQAEENEALKKRVSELTGEMSAKQDEAQSLTEANNLIIAGQSDEAMQGVLLQTAHSVTRVWNSKTGSAYKNVGILGVVLDVARSGNNIHLKTLDTKGDIVELVDFGFHGFVEQVYQYLADKKGELATFIITWKPGNRPKLASDTMMLPQYQSLWT
jgi:hypothetical protein